MLNVFRQPSLAQVQHLATAAELPTGDLSQADLAHFFGAGTPDEVWGVVGLELLGDAAGLGVRSLDLLATTAADFFERLGYQRVARDSAPAAVQGTREFASRCPASAAFMRKRLGAG